MSGVRTAVEKSRSEDAAAPEPRSRRPARAPEGSIAAMVPRLFSRGNHARALDLLNFIPLQ